MLKYRPEIDGLRTIAIIPVIIFHLGYNIFKGGYMGVDIFFVISGYLMTRIILADIEKGDFSFSRFWLRRIKRILPLLITVVLLTLVFSHLFIFKPILKEISRDAIPAVFSYFNFHALNNFGNYWGSNADESFFLHTWSLSVEEQFYIIYPIFLSISSKFFKKISIPVIIFTVISFSLFVLLLKINKNTDFTFYMLPTRIWEFSVGALAALVNGKKIITLDKYSLMSFVGIGFIFYSYLFGSEFLGLSVLFPVTGTALLLLYSSPQNRIGKILASKFFVFVGKLSYSLYLWHLVVIVFFKNCIYQLRSVNQQLFNLLIILIVFVLSYLTYTFIEIKTRNNKYTAKLVLVAITLITGLSLFYKSKFFNPYYESKFNKQISYLDYYDISPNQKANQLNLQKNDLYYNVIVPHRQEKFKDAYMQEGLVSKQGRETPEMVLIGDSHGVMWAKMLNDIADEIKVSYTSYATNGSMPFFNIENLDSQTANESFTQLQRIAYAKSFISNMEKWKPRLLIVACRWNQLNQVNHLIQFFTYFKNKSITILLLLQPPVLHFMKNRNANQFISYLNIKPVAGFNLLDVNDTSIIQSNRLVTNLVSDFKNVLVYDTYENMTEKGKVKVSFNKEVMYFDDDHMSYNGTLIHKDNVAFIIKKILLH